MGNLTCEVTVQVERTIQGRQTMRVYYALGGLINKLH